ncbi:hypothetical protein MKEN_00052900 [Mycena kentingensis (nom. inval.)]|nr:hypothetical protein MKEN_00052900 [Mycena kentingensis (nom. inval.)]
MPVPHSLFPHKSLWKSAPYMVNDSLFATFPVELRVEIFRQYCGQFCPIDKTNHGPLLLMRVSRAWRTLTMQSPQLWSSFALNIDQPVCPQSGRRLISLLKLWIDLSKSTLLSFSLRYPKQDAFCVGLIQTILPVSDRWREVALQTPHAALLSFLTTNPDRFPALRSLGVECAGLPPLQLRNYDLNWAQLSKLDLFLITFPALDDCIHILRQGVNLTSCRMHVECALDEQHDLAPIVLPKLRDLQLVLHGISRDQPQINASEAKFYTVLDALELPGLRSLELGWNIGGGPYRWPHMEPFIRFIRRVGANLERLRLDYLPFDKPELVSILKAVPSLRQLSLSHSRSDHASDYINDTFFDSLTRFVPLLESLSLNCNGGSFRNSTFLRFMESRWRYQPQGRAGGCLEHVEIISAKRLAEYIPGRFRDIIEGKLEVRGTLQSKSDMILVLRAYLKDSYKSCFLRSDLPLRIRSLLVM